GASSCPEESSKSKEALHELRASLCTCLSNGMILPLQYGTLRGSPRESEEAKSARRSEQPRKGRHR
nr:hypothetical protein [Tanacetum cinerariifolium]